MAALAPGTQGFWACVLELPCVPVLPVTHMPPGASRAGRRRVDLTLGMSPLDRPGGPPAALWEFGSLFCCRHSPPAASQGATMQPAPAAQEMWTWKRQKWTPQAQTLPSTGREWRLERLPHLLGLGPDAASRGSPTPAPAPCPVPSASWLGPCGPGCRGQGPHSLGMSPGGPEVAVPTGAPCHLLCPLPYLWVLWMGVHHWR